MLLGSRATRIRSCGEARKVGTKKAGGRRRKEAPHMSETVYTSYPVFGGVPERLPEAELEIAAKEVHDLLESYEDRVAQRGIYSTAGFGSTADLVFWWSSASPDHLQDAYVDLRRTRLGRALVAREVFLGLVRPAEFAADHRPAFVTGAQPKKYLCVYPFVRTPDWYLLPPDERGKLLGDHGLAGREFPDVLANTTAAFGLGDYEWILAFEADSLDRIVDLIRRLRATEARRYTKVEVPFFTGVRKPLFEAIADLP
jgi:hydrogen peroxide-dependent heme synthase